MKKNKHTIEDLNDIISKQEREKSSDKEIINQLERDIFVFKEKEIKDKMLASSEKGEMKEILKL